MTPTQLIALGVRSDRAFAFAGPLTVTFDEFGIDTPLRQQLFLSQILHESGMLRFLKELWGPTDAQKTYERDFTQPWGPQLKRGDRNYKAWRLGNSEPGDGFRYRGRGAIQITGRANYTAAGKALGLDLVRYPEQLESPLIGTRAAGYWWQSNKLNAAADTGCVDTVSDLVNLGRHTERVGDANGYPERLALFVKATEVVA